MALVARRSERRPICDPSRRARRAARMPSTEVARAADLRRRPVPVVAVSMQIMEPRRSTPGSTAPCRLLPRPA
eukprot:11183917-Lingulodinium_polyedra.AAC.1